MLECLSLNTLKLHVRCTSFLTFLLYVIGKNIFLDKVKWSLFYITQKLLKIEPFYRDNELIEVKPSFSHTHRKGWLYIFIQIFLEIIFFPLATSLKMSDIRHSFIRFAKKGREARNVGKLVTINTCYLFVSSYTCLKQ